MISDERRFRRDYNEYRNEERGRNRSGDMNYGDAAGEQAYDREYDRSTGYNRSRDYGSRIYERRNLPDNGHYNIQDYDYNRGNEGTYGREPGLNEDFRSNRYELERDYRRAREAAPGYHGANYENPENSDSSYKRNRDRREDSRRYQDRRNHWEPNDIDRMSPYDIGLGPSEARDRNRTHYGGRTEFDDSRNNHSGPREDRGFFGRAGEKARSWFGKEEPIRRDRDRRRNSYDHHNNYNDRDRY